MDKETTQILSKGEAIYDYVNSQGWSEVKEIFTNKILDLQSIKNLSKGVTATTLAKEISVRECAVDILMEIIKEVEGRAEQYQGNAPMMQDVEIL